jgi:16S rRNA pseudouridine516 synthase
MTPPPKMALEEILFSQGFGARKQCEALIRSAQVKINDEVVVDPAATFITADLQFEVLMPPALLGMPLRGENACTLPYAVVGWHRWQYREVAVLMLHKPGGYEVSQKPTTWPSVYGLLPMPLRQRRKGALQAVGRLDQDTTGLLIFTDDGGLLHRLTSPKKEVEKCYRVRLEKPIDEQTVNALLSGVNLLDVGRPSVMVRASSCVVLDDSTIAMGITQGKYHQVKRMVAAVGNRVLALHRERIGG